MTRTSEDASAIAAIDTESKGEPVTAEWLTWTNHCRGWSTWTAERVLERLTSKGFLKRHECDTYCSDCGSDSGVEYRYTILPKGAARGETE